MRRRHCARSRSTPRGAPAPERPNRRSSAARPSRPALEQEHAQDLAARRCPSRAGCRFRAAAPLRPRARWRCRTPPTGRRRSGSRGVRRLLRVDRGEELRIGPDPAVGVDAVVAARSRCATPPLRGVDVGQRHVDARDTAGQSGAGSARCRRDVGGALVGALVAEVAKMPLIGACCRRVCAEDTRSLSPTPTPRSLASLGADQDVVDRQPRVVPATIFSGNASRCGSRALGLDADQRDRAARVPAHDQRRPRGGGRDDLQSPGIARTWATIAQATGRSIVRRRKQRRLH